MKIGMYKIGRYHAIIKRTYEDGSVDFETSFSDAKDFYESVYANQNLIGELVGIYTDNPRVLANVVVVRGKENITKELC